eukprot:jgi/Mesvir1/4491/Mv09575-RA.1
MRDGSVLRSAVIVMTLFTLELALVESPGYTIGAPVKVECMDWATNEWGHGPVCKETGEELSVLFGYDTFLYCGLDMPDQAVYDNLVKIVKLEKAWHCRVPMAPGDSFYVPFTISLWGVVEDDHIHIDNHLNLVFHVDNRKIIGAAVYPVRDRFQFAKPGAIVSLHGPVRWFHRQSFQLLTTAGAAEPEKGGDVSHPVVLAGACTLSSLLTLLGAAESKVATSPCPGQDWRSIIYGDDDRPDAHIVATAVCPVGLEISKRTYGGDMAVAGLLASIWSVARPLSPRHRLRCTLPRRRFKLLGSILPMSVPTTLELE